MEGTAGERGEGGGGGGVSSVKRSGRRLTRPDLDWPDEDGAERQGGHHGHAPRHRHHDVVIEPDAGRAALHSAEETRRRKQEEETVR